MARPLGNFIRFILGATNTLGVLVAGIWLLIDGYWIYVIAGILISYIGYKLLPISPIVVTPRSLVELYRNKGIKGIRTKSVAYAMLTWILVSGWSSSILIVSMYYGLSINHIFLALLYAYGIISSPFSSLVLKYSANTGPLWAKLLMLQISLQFGLIADLVFVGLFGFGYLFAEISISCFIAIGVWLALNLLEGEIENVIWYENGEIKK